MVNLFTYFDGALPHVVHRNENVLKNIFEREYKEIRDRQLLEILKKDRTWLKYELHCNVKTPATFFFPKYRHGMCFRASSVFRYIAINSVNPSFI